MAKIHLVRHGRTVLNEQRRTQGACDSPLTRQGRAGAVMCRDYLAGTSLTAAYTSPQGRAMETSEILLQAHPGLVATRLSGLREYNYGHYDGGPDAQMHAALPVDRHLPGVLAGTHPGAPGGIHARDYLADMDGALARILSDLQAQAAVAGADPEVLVVSHGMTITILALRWLGTQAVQALVARPLANCSVTTVKVDPGAPDGAPELLAWGEDPGRQGVTFQVGDMSEFLDAVVPAPLDLSRPEGL
ncbi:histidine phosphatase family protein [Actinomyces sp. 2119]|uniref:Histidine phosphatase family protein n=1 Tax=Actinomyces lilanjuaniae TaxID=2321394 RepID=A0ABN5PMZ5_9ACTO|nr:MULTISPECIES: histidine phosphatase family protein [Actinomyces]AYD89713.1 histidine phosphatase family protein [Actinomyces lilanjuaniae]RJF44675.1 histidine phosphatase family protein [Actinomyces sp. 2119]